MTHPEAVALWRKFKAEHPEIDDHSAGVFLLNVEMAERERCAKIAEERANWARQMFNSNYRAAIADHIVGAIRRQEYVTSPQPPRPSVSST
jgi:hypothetical protein